jgi:hypothetical protein
MKIKNARIEGLVNGLRALDGVNSGTPQFKPYRFPNSKVSYAIARNLRKTKEAAEVLEETRVRTIKELLPTPESTELGGRELNEFTDRMREVLRMETELDLWLLKWSELSNNGANEIPATVIEQLFDVIQFDPLRGGEDGTAEVAHPL